MQSWLGLLQDDKRNWGSKSLDPVNLLALLRSTYVQTLCNILPDDRVALEIG